MPLDKVDQAGRNLAPGQIAAAMELPRDIPRDVPRAAFLRIKANSDGITIQAQPKAERKKIAA